MHIMVFDTIKHINTCIMKGRLHVYSRNKFSSDTWRLHLSTQFDLEPKHPDK